MSESPSAAGVLIVAYGNPLRGDDGLAWRAADELERRLSEVAVLRRHQLSPELAEDVSRCKLVIFVDAAAGQSSGRPGEVRVVGIRLEDSPQVADVRFSHHLSPAVLVALSERLYSARPRAFCVTLTGQDFEHGESLSPAVQNGLPTLVRRVEELVREAGS